MAVPCRAIYIVDKATGARVVHGARLPAIFPVPPMSNHPRQERFNAGLRGLKAFNRAGEAVIDAVLLRQPGIVIVHAFCERGDTRGQAAELGFKGIIGHWSSRLQAL